MKTLLVFDFDGVVADSEALANGVLADYFTELGAR
jgi:beta-phosphoglucomutase-like phosphatase (HAD superfamily)